MGRPEFSQPGTKGSGDTVATQNRPDFVQVNASQSGSVAAGTSEATEIYAEAGAVYKVMSAEMRVLPDANATTGDHTIRLLTFGNIDHMLGSSGHSAAISYIQSIWKNATLKARPSSNEFLALQAVKADETRPIKIVYSNDTDAAQDNNREYSFAIEKEAF